MHPYPPSTPYHNLFPPNYSTYYPSRSYHQTPATEPTNKGNSYLILICADYHINDSIPHSKHNNPIIGNKGHFILNLLISGTQNQFLTFQINTYSNIVLCIVGNLIRVSQQYRKKEIKVTRTKRGQLKTLYCYHILVVVVDQHLYNVVEKVCHECETDVMQNQK